MMAKRERDKETPEEIRQAFRVFDKVVIDTIWGGCGLMWRWRWYKKCFLCSSIGREWLCVDFRVEVCDGKAWCSLYWPGIKEHKSRKNMTLIKHQNLKLVIYWKYAYSNIMHLEVCQKNEIIFKACSNLTFSSGAPGNGAWSWYWWGRSSILQNHYFNFSILCFHVEESLSFPFFYIFRLPMRNF